LIHEQYQEKKYDKRIIICIIIIIMMKLKYNNLITEIQRMWNIKCFVIPVIIGATGTVSKSLQKYLETIPRQHSIDSLQKTAILGTSHIVMKVLQAETLSLSGVGSPLAQEEKYQGRKRPCDKR
jgi:hypothetical protein